MCYIPKGFTGIEREFWDTFYGVSINSSPQSKPQRIVIRKKTTANFSKPAYDALTDDSQQHDARRNPQSENEMPMHCVAISIHKYVRIDIYTHIQIHIRT